MEDTPAAAGDAPAPQTEQTPTSTNAEPTQAPNMYGFTEAQLEEMSKFYSANGGYEKAFGRVKSVISNPQPAPAQQSEAQPANEPTSQPQHQPQPEPQYKTPEGAITAQEFLAQQYFQSLAKEEKYAPIAKGIQSGEYLKEMSAFGINALNQDGSINDQKVRMYLDLKAQTVPAQPTGTEPNASSAPTVEYFQVDGDKITTMDQAYAIIQQDAQLRAAGLAGHPLNSAAEEFVRTKGKPVTKS